MLDIYRQDGSSSSAAESPAEATGIGKGESGYGSTKRAHTHTDTHTHIVYRSIPLLGIVPFLRCFEALVGFEILQIMLRSTTDTAILKIRMLLQGSRPNSWA